MINPFEILETINMIDKQNLDIRTITMGRLYVTAVASSLKSV